MSIDGQRTVAEMINVRQNVPANKVEIAQHTLFKLAV